MTRLRSILIRSLIILSVLFTSMYAHNGAVFSKSSVQGCQTSCTSHAQLLAVNSQTKNDEDDEKEPTPPLFSWAKQAIDLLLLYGAFVFTAYWIFTKLQKIHLTTQLRF
ncbi:MAG: hypothetical protein ACO1N2_01395 [Candidatus Saccharimonadota bacterium]